MPRRRRSPSTFSPPARNGTRSSRSRTTCSPATGKKRLTTAEIIERATRNALLLAERHGLESIALPAFGTGVGGFPLDECAKIMADAVHAHEATSLRLVRFVLFGERAYRAFVAAAHVH